LILPYSLNYNCIPSIILRFNFLDFEVSRL
jgi:hypothetical protein